MPSQIRLSPYQQHVNKWKNCTECPLCEVRKKVALFRGSSIPCDVLFIGDSPGPSEDALGHPFVGPAGHLLNRIIAQSIPSTVSLGFTNLIACFPKLTEEELEENPAKKYRDPKPEEIKACKGRLIEIVRLCKPKVLVLVGDHANKYISGEAMFSVDQNSYCGWLPDHVFLKFYHIIHPAAILKADETKKELFARRAAATLEEAVRGL